MEKVDTDKECVKDCMTFIENEDQMIFKLVFFVSSKQTSTINIYDFCIGFIDE